jgi:hypothetical protein
VLTVDSGEGGVFSQPLVVVEVGVGDSGVGEIDINDSGVGQLGVGEVGVANRSIDSPAVEVRAAKRTAELR